MRLKCIFLGPVARDSDFIGLGGAWGIILSTLSLDASNPSGLWTMTWEAPSGFSCLLVWVKKMPPKGKVICPMSHTASRLPLLYLQVSYSIDDARGSTLP